MKIVECEITESLHIAAQYLAAAGESFVEPQAIGMHASFGWNADRQALITRDLNKNGLFMALNLSLFRIEFLRNGRVLASRPLTGSTHKEMLDWLWEVFRDLEFEGQYSFNLPYDLPKGKISDDFTFEHIDPNELIQHAAMRDQAYRVLKNFAEKHIEEIEVRTWPYHFDTSALMKLGGRFRIDVGLTIPDGLVDCFYYYVKGWNGKEQMAITHFPALKHGSWMDTSDENAEGGWKGAIMKYKNQKNEEILSFLNEAVDYLK